MSEAFWDKLQDAMNTPTLLHSPAQTATIAMFILMIFFSLMAVSIFGIFLWTKFVKKDRPWR